MLLSVPCGLLAFRASVGLGAGFTDVVGRWLELGCGGWLGCWCFLCW